MDGAPMLPASCGTQRAAMCVYVCVSEVVDDVAGWLTLPFGEVDGGERYGTVRYGECVRVCVCVEYVLVVYADGDCGAELS